ncbi:MAG: ankyrin repeat domain-containing protein [Acidobacteriaceae bacterium]|jgi:ankyrin repeat protein
MTYRGAQNLIKRGDEAGLRAALEQSLDPNLANQNGWTLLMLAAVEGNVPVGRLLIEKGAAINARNNKEDTALTLATHRGFAAFVDLLTLSGGTAP